MPSTSPLTPHGALPPSPLSPLTPVAAPDPAAAAPAGGATTAAAAGREDLSRGLGFVLDGGNRFARGPIDVMTPLVPGGGGGGGGGQQAQKPRLPMLLPRPNQLPPPQPQQLPSPSNSQFFPWACPPAPSPSSHSALPPLPPPPAPYMLLPRSHVGPEIDVMMLRFLRDAQQRAAAALASARDPAQAEAVMAELAGPESADYSGLWRGSRWRWRQGSASSAGSARSASSSDWSSTSSSSAATSSSSATATAAAALAGGPWPSTSPSAAPGPPGKPGARIPRSPGLATAEPAARAARQGSGGGGQPHKLARLFGDIMLTFPNVRLAERAATVYIMHRLMRWQLWPTPHTYALLPVWLRPSVSQILVPHQHWLDYLVW
jgi:hypothetical protein